MAFEKPLLINTFTAASDMSAASMQFCFVEMDSSGNCHLANAATDLPLGVLQNLPSRGQLAEVLVLGVSKVRAGGTDLSVGALIGVDSTSRAAALTVGSGASTASYVAGRVIQIDASDNDGALVTANINCLTLNRAV